MKPPGSKPVSRTAVGAAANSAQMPKYELVDPLRDHAGANPEAKIPSITTKISTNDSHSAFIGHEYVNLAKSQPPAVYGNLQGHQTGTATHNEPEYENVPKLSSGSSTSIAVEDTLFDESEDQPRYVNVALAAKASSRPPNMKLIAEHKSSGANLAAAATISQIPGR